MIMDLIDVGMILSFFLASYWFLIKVCERLRS